MSPGIQDMHAGKGKTAATVKRSVVSSVQVWGEGGIGRAHRIFRAVKTVCTTPWFWIYGITIYPNPCNIQQQEWTLMWTLGDYDVSL